MQDTIFPSATSDRIPLKVLVKETPYTLEYLRVLAGKGRLGSITRLCPRGRLLVSRREALIGLGILSPAEVTVAN